MLHFITEITIRLRKMKENGSMQKLVRKWLPADTSEQCSNYKSEPLGLDMTFTTFVFLIVIGVICAIIGNYQEPNNR